MPKAIEAEDMTREVVPGPSKDDDMNLEFTQLKNKVDNMGQAVRALQTDMKDIKHDLAIVKNNTGWLKWGLGMVITVILALGGGFGGYMTYLLSRLVNK